MEKISDNGQKKDIVIFGLGPFALIMTRYIELFTNWKIVAYTADDSFCERCSFANKPIVPFSNLASLYSPDEVEVLLAVGYTRKGMIRKHAFLEIKQNGYIVSSFVHPDASVYAKCLGEGNLILERAILGMDSRVGNANLFWNGSNLSHECSVGDFNTFCPSASFGGCCAIGNNCFFGVGSVCRDHLQIGSFTFLGASSYLDHDVEQGSYVVNAGS